MPVEDGNYPQRVFIRRVNNQIISNSFEAERTECQIWPTVTLLRKSREFCKRSVKVVDDAVRSILAVFSDIYRDFINIVVGFGMKFEPVHSGLWRRASMLARRRAKASSPGISLTLPLLMSS